MNTIYIHHSFKSFLGFERLVELRLSISNVNTKQCFLQCKVNQNRTVEILLINSWIGKIANKSVNQKALASVSKLMMAEFIELSRNVVAQANMLSKTWRDARAARLQAAYYKRLMIIRCNRTHDIELFGRMRCQTMKGL